MNNHLTAEQREALAQLYRECNTAELLRCLAGLLLHNVKEYELAESVSRDTFRLANQLRDKVTK